MIASHYFQRVAAFTIRSNGIVQRNIPSFQTARFAGDKASGRVSGAVVDKDLMSKTTKDSKKNKNQSKLDTNPPKGTRDFYPEDMRLQTWLFTQWREVAKAYGFSEYDAPNKILKNEVLYRKFQNCTLIVHNINIQKLYIH